MLCLTVMKKDTAKAMAEHAKKVSPNYILALGDNFYWEGVEDLDDPGFRSWERIFLQYEKLNVPWKVCFISGDQAQFPRWSWATTIMKEISKLKLTSQRVTRILKGYGICRPRLVTFSHPN